MGPSNESLNIEPLPTENPVREPPLATGNGSIPTIDEVAVDTPHPVAERERIVALDVLRGVALLGILPMNIRSFAAPFAAYFNPLAMFDYSGASRAAYWATTLLFDTKMISIFSMLFGAGALIYSEKPSTGKTSPTRLWYRRNFWLLVIGLVHAYLIWTGDILVVYSLCGFIIVWWTRKLPAWALALLATVMFAIGGLLVIGQAAAFQILTAEEQAAKNSLWQPTPDELAGELAVYRDGYLGIVAHRAPEALMIHTMYFLWFFLWRAGGMMVLGQGLMKWGILTGARSSRFYLTMALLGYLVGFPIVWIGLAKLEAAEFVLPQRFMLDLYNYFGSIAVALGHVGLVLWLFQRWPRSPWFDRLAAVGRMALTNYLMQSLLCTTLFYGYGFNLFGRLDYARQLAVVAAVWALQLTLSPWWLRRFQFGPVEWLWRWLTYGVRPPMLLRNEQKPP
jgi:uncharacterized protein